MLRIAITILLFLYAYMGNAQDTIIISNDRGLLNRSITEHFHLFEHNGKMDFKSFLRDKKELEERKMNSSVENLDFTTSSFFIDFVLVNESGSDLDLVLETARPITNEVFLLESDKQTVQRSGDAVRFTFKAIHTNKSALPLLVPQGSSKHFILKLSSDGEIISLPFILWERKMFEESQMKVQYFVGIFYGIFLFVIIIYLTFYFMLKDSLFLFYSIYVLMSGLLQFALDGYFHQYIFKSGGYLTQHIVIVVAGLTVFFALQYASRYLKLQGRVRKITISFAWFAMLSVLASLIPGIIYEISYPLINGLSFIAVLYLLIVALRIRRVNPDISRLFIIGLMTLLIGAVVFILGNFSVIDIPDLTQNSLKFGTLVEIICLSILMAGKYKSLQDEKEAAQRQLVIELEEKNKLMTEANVILEQQVAERTREIEEQRLLLKEKNDDFTASITYAERIQRALLSNETKFKEILPESFILYRPKDIVSGDFFWIDKIEPNQSSPNGLIVYATADCTGHGVPGAFVSIICNNLLKLGRNNDAVHDPGTALDFVNREINEVLNSKYKTEQIRDGMDVALCAIDPVERKLYFSGAKNGVLIIREGVLIELKGDRAAIGFSESDEVKFTTQEFELKEGDMLYTFSDGYVDQFGGPKGKKFTIKRLKELLVSIHNKELTEQFEHVQTSFKEWLGDQEQIDDVLLIGVRIS